MYVKDQENRAKTVCRKICGALSGKVAVIDNEMYVILDPSETPDRKFYHCQNSKEVYEQKVKKKSKFPEKILLWQAIDSFGNISEHFITKGFVRFWICKKLDLFY